MKKTRPKTSFVIGQTQFSLTTNRKQSDGRAYFFASWDRDNQRYIIAANEDAKLPGSFEKPNSKDIGKFFKVYQKTTWKNLNKR